MTAKREAILEKAQPLFARYGYHAVGVDRIKEEAGVSKMTLYKYFPTKDALIESVLERRDAQMRESIRAALACFGTPLERLEALFAWHAAWFAEPDFYGCLFIKACDEFPDRTCAIRQVAVRHKRWIEDTIRTELAAIGHAEERELAACLMVLLEGMIVQANLQGGAARASGMWDMIRTRLIGV
ncbi:TetR/AcrR family transcriptional regulator [Paludibacterium paludis]|uniref:TetR family transcriptional regulator n=1 Tax=Paludibacterium paludis TaxID=1225769 RepID=A0A918UBU5_9NEIS|nr:TetR/AcrR family transcriptional regulator [Paludibacterium paludis]GGY24944.1 TetR family transcriptional regulator [Paludibacterium paludis]